MPRKSFAFSGCGTLFILCLCVLICGPASPLSAAPGQTKSSAVPAGGAPVQPAFQNAEKGTAPGQSNTPAAGQPGAVNSTASQAGEVKDPQGVSGKGSEQAGGSKPGADAGSRPSVRKDGADGAPAQQFFQNAEKGTDPGQLNAPAAGQPGAVNSTASQAGEVKDPQGVSGKGSEQAGLGKPGADAGSRPQKINQNSVQKSPKQAPASLENSLWGKLISSTLFLVLGIVIGTALAGLLLYIWSTARGRKETDGTIPDVFVPGGASGTDGAADGGDAGGSTAGGNAAGEEAAEAPEAPEALPQRPAAFDPARDIALAQALQESAVRWLDRLEELRSQGRRLAEHPELAREIAFVQEALGRLHKRAAEFLELGNMERKSIYTRSAQAGKACRFTLTLYPKGAKITDVEGLEAAGLNWEPCGDDPRSCVISGVPLLSRADSAEKKAFTVTYTFHDEAGNMPFRQDFTLNILPDPRALWKFLPSDCGEYPAPDAAGFAGAGGDARRLLAASVRGRSHAHEGRPRDDSFKLAFCQGSGWHILAVADGAGSAQFSREGSRRACEVSVSCCEGSLAERDSAVDQAIAAWAEADTAFAAKLAELEKRLASSGGSGQKEALAQAVERLEQEEKDFSARRGSLNALLGGLPASGQQVLKEAVSSWDQARDASRSEAYEVLKRRIGSVLSDAGQAERVDEFRRSVDAWASAKEDLGEAKAELDALCQGMPGEERRAFDLALRGQGEARRRREEAHANLMRQLYQLLVSAAYKAQQNIFEEARQKGRESRLYATTLLLVLCKKFDFGWAVASFGVGDGAMAALWEEDGEFRAELLAEPDEGEYGGQTRFLTMREIFAGGKAMDRLRFRLCQDLTGVLAMTDGVSDAKFETSANLHNHEKWRELWKELSRSVLSRGESAEEKAPAPAPGHEDAGQSAAGAVPQAEKTPPADRYREGIENALAGADSTAEEKALAEWLLFWSQGNHDDRTIAILY